MSLLLLISLLYFSQTQSLTIRDCYIDGYLKDGSEVLYFPYECIYKAFHEPKEAAAAATFCFTIEWDGTFYDNSDKDSEKLYRRGCTVDLCHTEGCYNIPGGVICCCNDRDYCNELPSVSYTSSISNYIIMNSVIWIALTAF